MFASQRVTRFAATGLGLAALSTAATASAVTSPDDDFLAAISETKASPTTRRGWLSRMPSTCAAPSTTVPIRSTSDEILSNTDLSTRQAAVFVVESVFNCCPEHTSLLP